MNLATKICVGVTLSLGFGISLYSYGLYIKDRPTQVESAEPKYFFESMGEIKLENMMNGERTIDIECADMDGDGDLALIVSD
ncbi:MAG: hypothetical protein AABX72_02555, partial [Nanoarchaeota archaeon]